MQQSPLTQEFCNAPRSQKIIIKLTKKSRINFHMLERTHVLRRSCLLRCVPDNDDEDSYPWPDSVQWEGVTFVCFAVLGNLWPHLP